MTAPVRSSVRTASQVSEVFDLLTSARWVELKAARFRDGSRVVRREPSPDGGLLLEVSRELPQGAPGFLARLLPEDRRVVQTDEWAPADADGVRSGTWAVRIPGVPAKLGGTLRLEPSGTGSQYLVEGQTKVSVPLVGGRAESYIAEMVGKLGSSEGELLQQALRG